MADDIHPRRILLGMRGWPHPEWRGGYFPEDLPLDWEFAYFSNDADCLLLPAGDWLALEEEQLSEWLDDCGPGFRFFLEQPEGGLPKERLAWFGDHLGGLLPMAGRLEDAAAVPVQSPAGEGMRAGSRILLEWVIDGLDLRSLKERVLALPDQPAAIIVRGEGVTPQRLFDIRTLIDLTGRG